ncbi:unnamed protein product [Cyclocybe aegerita]|uniref:Uncharacterized protein n=1 Tax=Cyclocybe aegerita TaxID=1973307 RepID=A0A8S0WIU3_CYCAE|nr:unnamed protein product [Cyclocybe aegerita]
MNDEDSSRPTEHVDKGKRRAQEPSERTPLLASSSRTIEEIAEPPDSRRRLRATLTTVFLVSLSICISFFILAALFAWSYASRASNLDPEHIINHDLVFSGPDKVDVLNITDDGGIWLNVKGRMGMDAGAVIGVGSSEDDGFLEKMWKAVGRWGVRTLDRVSVNLTTIRITTDYDSSAVLVTVDVPPIEVPLAADPPMDKSWLTKVSTPALIHPTKNTTLLFRFLKESWHRGTLDVRADVGQAFIRGGPLNVGGWRSKFMGRMSNIKLSLRMKMPSIPGFPPPGRNVPFPSVPDLVKLQSFRVASEDGQLALNATATVVNPVPADFVLSVPSLPFVISLPHKPPIDLASVSTKPFRLAYPKVTLSISGNVLPISTSSFNVLSQFVTRYLSGQSNIVLVSSPLLPNLSVEAEFPGPYPRPHLLRNVTIHDMKIRATGSVFLASGTVYARVVLPAGIEVGLDVFRVFPDVLIFDGEVPEPAPLELFEHKNHKKHNETAPPEVPLPDPLPEKAFGHIRPDDWLPSVSNPIEPEGGKGIAYEVSAKVVDVPLEVLPGRQKEFSNFVGKVIFGSDGATAGIQGSAAVTVAVEGLPLHGPGRKAGEVVLSGLPFQGSVLVRKKSLFKLKQGSTWMDILHRIRSHIPI